MSGLIILERTPLRVLQISGDRAPIEIWAETTAPTACCPTCGQPSHRVKSHYWRSPGDLPWRGWGVRWHLWVRRFVCPNPACPQAMFCERLPSVAPHQRWTEAARTTMVRWALIASASEVARRLRAEGLAVSRQTLNRWIQAVPLPDPSAPRVIGIDEWARRKGQTYATILVDHEQGALWEILPDTRPETVAAWLRAHPTVEIVTRDRDTAFARGIADGAPQAEPGADRWHLLRHWATAVERFFPRHREPPPAPAPPAASPDAAAEPAAPSREATRQQRWWQAIQDRLAQGESLSAIARALHLDRQTVRRYARMATPPPPSSTGRRRRPQQDRWQAVLEAAWVAGHHTVAALYAAARAQGYPGGRSTVYRWLVEHHGVRRRRGALPAGPPADPPLRPRQWATWLLQRWTTLPRTATRRLSQRLEDPVVRQVWTLVHQFAVLVRHRQERALASWLRRALASGIPELVRFAQGLQRDEAAVRAAIRGPWSQGRTEGLNYRIKRTIRVTYGRASFPLLRARLLAPREA